MAGPWEMFIEQFVYHFQNNALPVVVAAVVGGVSIGYTLHYLFNVVPQQKRDVQDEEEEKELLKEEELDSCEEIVAGNTVFKGCINKRLVATLRRPDDEIENEKLLPSYEEETLDELEDFDPPDLEDTSDEDEKPFVVPLKKENALKTSSVDEAGKRRFSENMGGCMFMPMPKQAETSQRRVTICAPSKSDFKPLNEEEKMNLKNLGPLHGKLATAQLRARTKRMEMEMTLEERKSEEDMKQQQLASIMALLEQNKEKFGLDRDQVEEQLNMYNF